MVERRGAREHAAEHFHVSVSMTPVPSAAMMFKLADRRRPKLSHERYALVTLFSGFPFGRGASSVRLVDLRTGEQQPLITGLTMAIDALPLGNWTNKLLVLEHASAFALPEPAGPWGFLPPGRLLRFATPIIRTAGARRYARDTHEHGARR